MRIDVSNMSYEQIRRLALSLPMGVENIALSGSRVLMEIGSPVA